MTVWIVLFAVAALAVSARWNWWRPRVSGLPVLMYHKIGTPPAESQLKKLWVTAVMFRRHLEYLKDHGYQTWTFQEVHEALGSGRAVPPNAVVLTFDDGYANNHAEAFPLLQEFRAKAVFYVVVNAVGRDNFWHDPKSEIRLPMMSWDQLRELQKQGFEIASHTLNHPRLSTIPLEQARQEFEESRARLDKELGSKSLAFAYPYGNGADDGRLQSLASAAGYKTAVSVHQGKADLKGNLFCLKRLFIRGDDNLWDFHLQLTRGRSRF